MNLLRKVVAGLIVFTVIEIVGLVYWLVYGNSVLGVAILVVALFAEHSLSLLVGAYAGKIFR